MSIDLRVRSPQGAARLREDISNQVVNICTLCVSIMAGKHTMVASIGR